MFFARNLGSSVALASVALTIAAGAPLPGAAADHEVLFRAGLDARSFDKWGEAVAFFGEAVEARSEEGGRVLWYGTWWFDYLPHFYLGEALYRVGRYAPAFEELTESLRQDEIRRKKRREIRELVEGFRGPCTRWQEGLEARRTEHLEAARRLRPRLETLGQDGGEREDLRRALERVETDLHGVEEELAALEGDRTCAAATEAGDLADTVAAGAELASRLEGVDRSLRASSSELQRIEEEIVEQRVSLAEEKAAAAKAKIDAFLEGRSSPQRRPRLVSHEVRSTVRAKLQEPSGPGWTLELTTEERAIEQYLMAIAKVSAGRCDDSVELLTQALQTLGPPGSVSVHPRVPYLPHFALAQAARNCGDRDAVQRELSLAEQAGFTADRHLLALKQWLERSRPFDVYGKKYALLVGGVSYREPFDTLPRVRDDLESIAEFLKTAGYELPMGPALIDRTKSELEDAIEEFLSTYGSDPRSVLLVYWAGHGETRENVHEYATGYILPFDMPALPAEGGEALIVLRESALDIETFHLWANNYSDALHTLFVFDSCHSGTVLNDLPKMDLQPFDPERAAQPVRLFLASGTAEQQVPSDTHFREQFLLGLEACADHDGDRHVTAAELADYLQRTVTESTPQGGKSRESRYGTGEFVFDPPPGSRDGCPQAAAWRKTDFGLEGLDPESVLEPPASILEETDFWERVVRRHPLLENASPEQVLVVLRYYTEEYAEPYFRSLTDRIRSRLEREAASLTARRATGASR